MISPVGMQSLQFPSTQGEDGEHSSMFSPQVGPIQPCVQLQLNIPGPVGCVIMCMCMRECVLELVSIIIRVTIYIRRYCSNAKNN